MDGEDLEDLELLSEIENLERELKEEEKEEAEVSEENEKLRKEIDEIRRQRPIKGVLPTPDELAALMRHSPPPPSLETLYQTDFSTYRVPALDHTLELRDAGLEAEVEARVEAWRQGLSSEDRVLLCGSTKNGAHNNTQVGGDENTNIMIENSATDSMISQPTDIEITTEIPAQNGILSTPKTDIKVSRTRKKALVPQQLNQKRHRRSAKF